METEFWLERWREGRTHFHMERVTPLLQKYWPLLGLPPGCKVLVPLCGKSLDMVWLADQGHSVLGIELSPIAVERFFEENALTPVITESALGRHYKSGRIEILCGDIFDLDADILGGCAGAYDRAALVALPADMRQRYVGHVYGQLAPGYRGLLLTLNYDQLRMEGPPFAVDEAEVRELYAPHTDVRLLDQRDIIDKEPKFKDRGLEHLDTLVFELQGK
ncbi:thiopurine S-methyltransferase [Pusillimonas sp. TS35]|uniref:thiopurine S-methyltransferase n=1 Tax=Paracandidimonas lactea TaxID=2895524 RepID=UPI00136B17F4|nr:thiopurine S-methyltransferase [Paracandidimonas lactea]MYN12901.1 thiopurine S-methyltransferase [Pusillimonas sp. TS35]